MILSSPDKSGAVSESCATFDRRVLADTVSEVDRSGSKFARNSRQSLYFGPEIPEQTQQIPTCHHLCVDSEVAVTFMRGVRKIESRI